MARRSRGSSCRDAASRARHRRRAPNRSWPGPPHTTVTPGWFPARRPGPLTCASGPARWLRKSRPAARRRPQEPDAIWQRSLITAGRYDRKPSRDRLAITRRRGNPGCAMRGQRIRADVVIAQGAKPATHGSYPARVHAPAPVLGDEGGRPGEVAGRQCVTDGLVG